MDVSKAGGKLGERPFKKRGKENAPQEKASFKSLEMAEKCYERKRGRKSAPREKNASKRQRPPPIEDDAKPTAIKKRMNTWASR